MNNDKRKTRLLSSVRTASALAGLIIITGYLLIILSAAVGTLLFQSDINGTNVDAILNTIAPDSEQTKTVQSGNQKTSTPIDAKASISVQDIKVSISSFFSSLGWNDFWRILGASFLMLWSGYILRVISVLSETQLIDYQSAE